MSENNDAHLKEPKIVPKVLQVNVVTFRERREPMFLGGICYVMDGPDKTFIALQEFIGAIIGCQGSWQSLGMSFNIDPASNSMEISILYTLLSDKIEEFSTRIESIFKSRDGKK
jgi:hypothetical protein